MKGDMGDGRALTIIILKVISMISLYHLIPIEFLRVSVVNYSPQQFMYFQFRGLPSVSHSIVVCNRFSRVSSRFASVIHSMYSR